MPIDVNQALDIPYTPDDKDSSSALRNEAYQTPSQEELLKLVKETEAKPGNSNGESTLPKLDLVGAVGEAVRSMGPNDSIISRIGKVWEAIEKQTRSFIAETTRIAGDRAQQDLFKYITEKVNTNGKTVAPELREIFELRQNVQEQLGKDWRLVQTQKDSPADLAGMDYLLINVKDGRYFILDSTLNADSKAKLPELRKLGIINIQLNEDRTPSIESRKQFAELILDLTSRSSPLNLKDTPPPGILAAVTLEEKEAELNTFRKKLETKAASMEAEAATKTGSEAQALKDQARLLRDYNSDLQRLQTFTDRKIGQQNDANFPKEQETFKDRTRKVIDKVVGDYLKGKVTPNNGSLSLKDGDRRFWVDDKRGSLVMRVDGKDYEVSDVVKILKDSFGDQFSKATSGKGNQDNLYALKRLFEANSGKSAVLAEVLTRLTQRDTDVLLGRNLPVANNDNGSKPGVQEAAKPKVEPLAPMFEDTRAVWKDLGQTGAPKGYSDDVVAAMELTAVQQGKLWEAERLKEYERLIEQYKAEKDKPEGQRPTIDRVNAIFSSEANGALSRTGYDSSSQDPKTRRVGDYAGRNAEELSTIGRDLEAGVNAYPRDGSDSFAKRSFIDSYVSRAQKLEMPKDASKRAGTLTKFIQDYFTGSQESGGLGSKDAAIKLVQVVASTEMNADTTTGGKLVFKNGTETFVPTYRDGADFVIEKSDGTVRRIPVDSTSIEIHVAKSKLAQADGKTAEGQWAAKEVQATIYHELHALNQLKNRNTIDGSVVARTSEFVQAQLNDGRLSPTQELPLKRTSSLNSSTSIEVARAGTDLVTRFHQDGRIEVIDRGTARVLSEREMDGHIKDAFDQLIKEARNAGNEERAKELEMANESYSVYPGATRSGIAGRWNGAVGKVGTAAGLLIIVSAALDLYIRNGSVDGYRPPNRAELSMQ